MSLEPGLRAEIESWVRPLYVDLDGVDAFDRVGRREALARELLVDRPYDGAYLELLALFHDPASRLGSTGPGSRWWLFLRGLGLDDPRMARLAAGLERWRESPAGAEEEALHDARLLEEVGVAACARRLWMAGRKRVPLGRAVATLDAGPVRERFRTPRGRRLAAERRRAAESWIAALQPAVAAERASSD